MRVVGGKYERAHKVSGNRPRAVHCKATAMLCVVVQTCNERRWLLYSHIHTNTHIYIFIYLHHSFAYANKSA